MKTLVLCLLLVVGCSAAPVAKKKHLHLVSHVVVGVAHGVGFVLKTVI